MNSLTTSAEKNISIIIEAAAMSNDLDIDKMSKLLDMQERILNKNAEISFNQAMAKALAEIPSFEESQAGYNFKYATFESINEVVKPILSRHGLFVTFKTTFIEGGVTVIAKVTHEQGATEETQGVFPFDKTGQKNNIQAVGSAISYGKRYMMNALLNISTHGEDDNAFKSQKQDKQGYSQIKFDKNFPEWKVLVESGEKQAMAIITQFSNSFKLTTKQMAEIMTLKDFEPKKEDINE